MDAGRFRLPPVQTDTHGEVVEAVAEPAQEAGEERRVAQEGHVAEDHERVRRQVVRARARRHRRDREQDRAVPAARVPRPELLREVAADGPVARVRRGVLELRVGVVGVVLLGVGHGCW